MREPTNGSTGPSYCCIWVSDFTVYLKFESCANQLNPISIFLGLCPARDYGRHLYQRITMEIERR